MGIYRIIATCKQSGVFVFHSEGGLSFCLLLLGDRGVCVFGERQSPAVARGTQTPAVQWGWYAPHFLSVKWESSFLLPKSGTYFLVLKLWGRRLDGPISSVDGGGPSIPPLAPGLFRVCGSSRRFLSQCLP